MGIYKKYRLLKDLPFAKAGEIFESRILDDGKEYMFWGEIKTEKIENFDEWFEKIKEPEFFYYIDEKGLTTKMRTNYRHADIHLRKAIGNYFETKEEAEKHIEWLKARAVLIEDTKGFKPDWNGDYQWKYFVAYDHEYLIFDIKLTSSQNHGLIHFRNYEDAENSIENHEKEWKIYLGVEE